MTEHLWTRYCVKSGLDPKEDKAPLALSSLNEYKTWYSFDEEKFTSACRVVGLGEDQIDLQRKFLKFVFEEDDAPFDQKLVWELYLDTSCSRLGITSFNGRKSQVVLGPVRKIGGVDTKNPFQDLSIKRLNRLYEFLKKEDYKSVNLVLKQIKPSYQNEEHVTLTTYVRFLFEE